MHQDAHEFLNYILNTIAEDVQKHQKRVAADMEKSSSSGDSADSTGHDSINSENSQENTSNSSTSKSPLKT